MAKKNKRQPRVIARGKILRISASLQANYNAALMRHVDAMIKDVRKEVEKHFKQDFAQEHFAADTVGMDANISSQTRILVNAFKRKYDQLFGSASGDLAAKMMNDVNRNSFDTSKMAVSDLPLKEKAKEVTLSLRSLDPKTLNVLKASTARAADFIKSIPERYLNTVADTLYKTIASGKGLQDLTEFLDKHDAGTKNWVRLTALDQTRKAYNGLNAGRMKNIGIQRGEWIHSGGSQHPRPLHEDYDGKTFDLNEGAPVGDDDGNMVMPGEEPNCRCTFAPVLTADEDATEEKEKEDGEGDAE